MYEPSFERSEFDMVGLNFGRNLEFAALLTILRDGGGLAQALNLIFDETRRVYLYNTSTRPTLFSFTFAFRSDSIAWISLLT